MSVMVRNMTPIREQKKIFYQVLYHKSRRLSIRRAEENEK